MENRPTTNKWMTMGIVFLGTVVSTLNSSIVNLANPTLAREFGVGIETVQWVSTIYLMVICSLMLLSGRIGDRIGSHKIYISGLMFFTAGSFLCGLAGGFTFLLAGRVVQAVGAAMIVATGMGIVTTSFPLSERGKAIGFISIAVGLGNMAGPSIGGFILGFAPWPFIFYLNIPFGIITIFLSIRYLRSVVPAQKQAAPLDYIGALLLAVLISSLILCLNGGFPGSTWLILPAAALIPCFIWYEKQHKAPMWDFTLLKNARFAFGNLLAFLSYFANMLVSFLLPFYMTQMLELPTAVMGLVMMISPLFMAIAAPLSGSLADKIGALRLMPTAYLLLTTSLLVFATLSAHSSFWHVGIGLFFLGSSMGMLNSPNNSEIMTAAGRKYAGYASGFVGTVRNLAFCFGTAMSAGVFSLLLKTFSDSQSYETAYMNAFHCIVYAAVSISFIGFLICLWLRSTQNKQATRPISG